MSNWNITEINNKFYLIKYVNNNNNQFNCILSDLESTWKEELSANDLLARAKEINPVVEIELEDLVARIFQLSGDMQIETITDDGIKKLSIKFKLDGYTLKFNWNLSKCNTINSPNDLMVSLICTMVQLKKQNTDLIEIIRKKDEEIEQHKFDGTTLTREKLITPKFDVQEFHDSGKLIHSKSNEFDQILTNTASTIHLLKLINIDLSIEALSSHGKIKESELKSFGSDESKKKSPILKKRKLPKTKHLPNRGPMNYGVDSDSSDDNDNDENKDNIQITRVLQKPKLGATKRVPF